MKLPIRVLGCAAMVVLLFFLEGCAGLYGGAKRKSNADLTLVSFGSINGELAPCG